MKKLTSYCLDWHINNSDAFRDMLVEPLNPYVKIELKAWNGEQLTHKHRLDEPLIFSMLPPPPSMLKSKQRMVWLPMWDQAQGYPQQWWDDLPKNLRVVAFSNVIYEKAQKANLPALRITYFKNPAEFTRVSWNKGLKVFYWNRTGMIGPDFLQKLCGSIRPTKLIFMGRTDPRIEENKYYELPDRFGDTEIIKIEPSDRGTFLNKTAEANIQIAPRLTEGVGMTFLEMMSRGGVVIAHNAPTMSEYIENGKNGILIGNNYHSKFEILRARFKQIELKDNAPSPYLLSDKQPWHTISNLDFNSLGDSAYRDHVIGYEKWKKDIKEYADFVLNW